MINNTIAIHDIYDTWYIPIWQRTSFYVALFLFCLFVVIGLLVIVMRRKKLKKIQRSFDEQVIYELEQLHWVDSTDREKGKYIYQVITLNLKKYLQFHLKLDVLTKTDEEVADYLQSMNVPLIMKQELTDIFLGSIQVKFAQEKVIRKALNRHIQESISFVKQMKAPTQLT